MPIPIQPSWNGEASAWLDYAEQCGIEVPEKIAADGHRDRIRRVVLAEVALLDPDDFDDVESDESDEPSEDKSDESDEPSEDESDESDESDDDELDPDQPPRNGSHAAWVEYAISRGADPEEARKTSRDDLISTFGS